MNVKNAQRSYIDDGVENFMENVIENVISNVIENVKENALKTVVLLKSLKLIKLFFAIKLRLVNKKFLDKLFF